MKYSTWIPSVVLVLSAATSACSGDSTKAATTEAPAKSAVADAAKAPAAATTPATASAPAKAAASTPAQAAGKSAMPKPGDVAPAFEVQDQLGQTVRLSDFAGKRVVLYFYPKADTPGCTKQGCAYRDHIEEYKAMDVEVLGISFDTPAENKAFAEKFSFPFRLLSDVDRKVALAYGACDTATDGYARRNTYVIGADGKIEQAIETKDAGGQAAELLKSL